MYNEKYCFGAGHPPKARSNQNPSVWPQKPYWDDKARCLINCTKEIPWRCNHQPACGWNGSKSWEDRGTDVGLLQLRLQLDDHRPTIWWDRTVRGQNSSLSADMINSWLARPALCGSFRWHRIACVRHQPAPQNARSSTWPWQCRGVETVHQLPCSIL